MKREWWDVLNFNCLSSTDLKLNRNLRKTSVFDFDRIPAYLQKIEFPKTDSSWVIHSNGIFLVAYAQHKKLESPLHFFSDAMNEKVT